MSPQSCLLSEQRKATLYSEGCKKLAHRSVLLQMYSELKCDLSIIWMMILIF